MARVMIRASMQLNFRPLDKAKKQAAFKGIYQAAGFIRTTARRSIKRRKTPSPAGQPPHTQTGRIKNALAFEVRNEHTAIIGARASIVGPILGVMEAGGRFRGTLYDSRPTMKPALQKALPRMPEGYRFR